ncbi:MAG: CBS domain-containing protein [Gammaproteobacteria bacterium]|nr:CBS domain-containing protein [Gammaproteobacteria bacterium]
MKVQELMTPKAESIEPGARTKEAAKKMRDLNIGSLPVMEDGKLMGIITDRDICCRVSGTGRDAVGTKVNEVMIKEVATCYEDDDIEIAANLMEGRHVRRLVVLHRDDSVAGILSVDDLARGSHELASEVLEAATRH